MLKNRLIPVLLLSNNGLVKTVKFKNPKYVGDPINAIRIFNEKEVDELMMLDILASKQNTEPNYKMIEQVASECFMPLGYGGGVKTLDQAKRIFSLGVEKICLQKAALENIHLVTELAEHFGSQSVVVSLDVKRNWLGKPEIYNAANGKSVNGDWKEYLNKVVAAGAGEIVLNSVDKDGTFSGPDLELIRKACEFTDVPVVALGGVSSLKDIKAAVDAGASAVAAGSFFVFHGPHRAVLITYPKRKELEEIFES